MIPKVGLDDEAQQIYERLVGPSFGMEPVAPVDPDDPARDPGYWESIDKEAERRWGPYTSETDAAKAESTLPNLPEDFWNARERFAQIRQAAWHIGCGADVTFLTVLCRASAMVSPKLNFDLGRGEGSLNFFGGAVGRSGAGKSQSVEVGQDILLPPSHLLDAEGEIDDDKFLDGVPLGTGEGIAEAFMGWTSRPTGEFNGKGQPKMEKVRAQVRYNVFYYLDEGETLSKMMMERQGTTIGQTIRSAWNGATLGQMNAREETTRRVRRRNYSLGMVVGYQPETAQALLADGAAGTPQRFLWMSALDPNLPFDRPDRPRRFSVPICNGIGDPVTGTIGGPDWLAKELRERRVRVGRGDEVLDRLDSHVDLMMCKLSALLAVIDGRLNVNDEDWQLANVIWATSCAVRDRLTEIGRREAHREREQQIATHVEREERAHTARVAADGAIVRIGRLVANWVHGSDDPLTERGPKRDLPSRDRKHYEAALEHAVAQGWVVIEGGLLLKGSARPA